MTGDESHKPEDFIDTNVVKRLIDRVFCQVWGDNTCGLHRNVAYILHGKHVM